MTGPCETPEFVTIPEAAVILRTSVRTVIRMLDSGALTRVKLGPAPNAAVRIRMDELRALGVSSDDTAGSMDDNDDGGRHG